MSLSTNDEALKILGNAPRSLEEASEWANVQTDARAELALLRDALALIRNEGGFSVLRRAGYHAGSLRLLEAVAKESSEASAMTCDLIASLNRRLTEGE